MKTFTNDKVLTGLAVCLMIFSLAVAASFTYISSTRQLSGLESVVTQVVVLGFGFLSSFVFGQLSANKSSEEAFRSHAKPAFRRIWTLLISLSRLATIIENDRESWGSKPTAMLATIDKIECIVIEQISAADDAVADWRDICPDEVEQHISNNANKTKMEQ